ncbi:MAG: hypothetical protein KC910_09095 [Candidatus Eremiobacteraeota bacterium]|nr:hypothetical protein [Candidatus Eremiobacteraeota bacterium]
MRIAIFLLLLTLTAQANPRVAMLRSFSGQVEVAGEAVARHQVLEEGAVLDLGDGAQVEVDYLSAGVRQSATGPAHLTVGPTGLSGARVRSQNMARLSMMPEGAMAKGAGALTRSINDPDEVTLRATRRTTSPAFTVIPLEDGVQGAYEVALSENGKTLWSTPVWPDQPQVVCPLKLEPGKVYRVSVIPSKPQLHDENYEVNFSPLTEAQDEDLQNLSADLHAMAREGQSPTPLLFLMEALADHYLFYDAAQVAEEVYKQGDLGQDRAAFLERARELNLAARRFSRARFFEAEAKR